MLQAVQEFLSAPHVEPAEPFSALLSAFIGFAHRIAGLLYMDFEEVDLSYRLSSGSERMFS